MYLEHFNFKERPFSLTPNTDFFCQLSGHQAALNILLLSLRNGEGFIKVVGEVGTGKTLLCRMLLEKLSQEYMTAYIHNPMLTPQELYMAFAQELGLAYTSPQNILLDTITKKLIELHDSGKRIALLIDEAQSMPIETLEALRLLTNLETNTTKLLQVVLFGQPELDVILNQPNMRQLKQRIVFSHYLPSLNREELEDYLCHRLAKAGHTLGPLFSRKACDLLFKRSQGIPRLINILCHKALMVAYGRGENKIHHDAMRLAIKDTASVTEAENSFNKYIISIGVGLIFFILALLITQYYDSIFKNFHF